MKNKPVHTSTVKTNGSDTVLRVLDSLLADPGQKRLTGSQATIILDALASSNDQALVIRFPAVLSICARNGVALNSHALFSKYWESSPKKQNLEKLLLISAELFDLEGIEAPKNLKKIASSLKAKYGTLLSAKMLPLSSGISISMRDIQNTLRDYTAKTKDAMTAFKQGNLEQEPTRDILNRSADLQVHLRRLFSSKQKDLVFKKLNRKPFTKTEREYYSRVVRKKLVSIANSEVSCIANRLTQK
ncbi:MAG: hypothetical protein V3V51_08075 [Desulfobacterales bacterium]|jgi:hypothetical protein|nr:hypothetical protein [Desulfobacterales bacterium]